MNSLVHSNMGLAHIILSCLALLLGTAVLVLQKGTTRHRILGYCYAASMIGVNGTALSIYRLFGTFGPFHFAALASLLTLAAGVIPLFFRKKIKSWLFVHMIGMYYSVIGLYSAFASEIVVRIPGFPFALSVIVASVLISAIGIFIFQTRHKTWMSNLKKSYSYGNG